MPKISFLENDKQLTKAKFHIQFMKTMFIANRFDDAEKHYNLALSIINDEIEKDSKNEESV